MVNISIWNSIIANSGVVFVDYQDFRQREEQVFPAGWELAMIALQPEPGNNCTLCFAVILDWCEHDKWHILIWTIAQQACSGRQ